MAATVTTPAPSSVPFSLAVVLGSGEDAAPPQVVLDPGLREVGQILLPAAAED